MIKKFNYILIFLLLTNCGYQAIYSNKDSSRVSVNKIELIGDKNINRKTLIWRWNWEQIVFKKTSSLKGKKIRIKYKISLFFEVPQNECKLL